MIGIISGAARLLGGQPVSSPVPLPDGVELRRSTLVTALGGWLAGMRGPAGGVTLGRVILISPRIEPDARLIRHELEHVRQWEESPVAFPFRYVSAHIRHGYGANPYEAEARAAERGPSRPGETR